MSSNAESTRFFFDVFEANTWTREIELTAGTSAIAQVKVERRLLDHERAVERSKSARKEDPEQ